LNRHSRLVDQPQPPPEELLDEPPEELLDGAVDELLDGAVDELLDGALVTSPPEGLISHHFAPNWSLPLPLVLPALVSPT
jgi:hypothetical protein